MRARGRATDAATANTCLTICEQLVAPTDVDEADPVIPGYVVGWTIAETENGEMAKEFIADTLAAHGIAPGQLALYAGRGTSMTSKPAARLHPHRRSSISLHTPASVPTALQPRSMLNAPAPSMSPTPRTPHHSGTADAPHRNCPPQPGSTNARSTHQIRGRILSHRP